jgi:hypothetical protein
MPLIRRWDRARPRLRVKVYWWLTGDWWWDRLERWVSVSTLERIDMVVQALQRPLCWLLGHQPERDQCNLPEHDYCLFCQKSMPGQAHRG